MLRYFILKGVVELDLVDKYTNSGQMYNIIIYSWATIARVINAISKHTHNHNPKPYPAPNQRPNHRPHSNSLLPEIS